MSAAPHWKQLPAPAARTVVRGSELEAWLELSRDREPRVRKRAAQHLCPCHVRASVDLVWGRILELLSDPDASVRRQAVHAIGDGSPRQLLGQVIPALEQAREDPDPKLRRTIRKLPAHHRRTGSVNIL